MPINVTPIAGLSPEINDVRRRTADLVNNEILPNEAVLWRSSRGAGAHRRGTRRRATRKP